jgi:hypothetical protein
MLVTGAATLVHLAAYRRIGRARRAWPTVDMEGGPVRLARDMGPAVVGLAKPEVVVPRWLLDRPADERRLVLVHEREHVRAHDPLLLAAGCAAAVLLAWHPAAWWMLARLRLAVETDCDRRVLRRGTTTRAYASLLIDLAGHDAGLPAGAPALAGRPTHLERRLLAMTTRTSRFPILRGGALAALASAAVLAACESKLPTAAEVEKMDVAAVEGRLLVEKMTGTDYFVDGVKITPDQARNLPPESIESVRVLKATMKNPADAAKAPSRIEITTKGAVLPSKVALKEGVSVDSMVASRRVASDGRAERAMGDGQRAVLRTQGSITISDSLITSQQRNGSTRALKMPSDAVPLFVIDDRVVSAEAMHALAPDAIESVEILKSQAATAAYGAAAKHGVVKVVTKKK